MFRRPTLGHLGPVLVALAAGCRMPSADLVLSSAEDTNAVAPPELETLESANDTQIPQARLAGYIALGPQTAIYSAPSPTTRVGTTGEQAFEALPWSVIGDMGDFIAVSSLNSDQMQGHCLDLGESFFSRWDYYALTGFVHRDELPLVSARPIERRYTDGSGLVVGAGTILDDIGGGARLRRRGLDLGLTPTADEVGLSWQVPGHGREGSEDYVIPPDGASYRLDGQAVDFYPLLTDASSVHWEPIEGGQARWIFTDRCLVVELVGPRPGAQGGGGYGSGSLGLRGSSGRKWSIPAHTEALWPDGSSAGQSLESREELLHYGVERGELVCFELYGELEVCHRRADLSVVP